MGLTLSGVTATLGGYPVLHSLDLEVSTGELVCSTASRCCPAPFWPAGTWDSGAALFVPGVHST